MRGLASETQYFTAQPGVNKKKGYPYLTASLGMTATADKSGEPHQKE